MSPRLALVLVVALLLAACAPSSDTALRNTLQEHPDIVLDALATRKANLYALVVAGQQEQQTAADQAKQSEELAKPLKPVIDPDRAMRGPATAPTTIVVYSDFLCPYCARGAKELKAFEDRHPDSVRVLFKHYATDDLSRQAALVYEALARQDPKLAFAFHDAIFASQQEIEQAGEPAIYALAIKLGANVSQLKRDLKDPALAKRIADDVAEARSFGIEGTPTFLINGVSLRGAAPVGEFENILRQVSPQGGQEAPCAVCDKEKAKK